MSQVRYATLLFDLFGASAYTLLLAVDVGRGRAEEVRFWLTFYERLRKGPA